MSTNPISTGIPTKKLYRGRLPEIYTEFIIYTRFISESVFYTQSVMLSPRFIPESVFYTQSVVRSPQFTVRSPQSISSFRHFAISCFKHAPLKTILFASKITYL